MNSIAETRKRRGRPPKARPAVDAPPENPIIPRKSGRPRKLRYGWNYVLDLAHVGLTDMQIRERLGMGRATWFKYLAEDSNREKLQAIRIAGKDDVRVAIYERACHGDVGAARLALEWLSEAGRNSRQLPGAAFVHKKG
jgi:hypothetical protein